MHLILSAQHPHVFVCEPERPAIDGERGNRVAFVRSCVVDVSWLEAIVRVADLNAQHLGMLLVRTAMHQIRRAAQLCLQAVLRPNDATSAHSDGVRAA